jgi:outer membrane lipoprotein
MKFVKLIIHSCGFVSIMLISACSSHIPPEIRQAVDDAPDVAQVRQQAEAYMSQKVRWGGVILNTENKQNTSWLTVIAFPLSDNGEPQVSDKSPGRFIAIIDEFVEPLVYSHDRKITVTGNLLRSETLKVGEFPYEYPVIQVDHYYLWPAVQEPPDINYYPYWWYDPWYYPYYPGYYPYYPHHLLR